MKAIVTQQNLSHGLNIVSRAVSPRSTLPVLANVLLATDEGRLRLSATNLELGITCWIPAQMAEEGSITIPARTLVDLVSTFPPDTVTLALDERTQTINLVCNSSAHEIKGIDAQDFPPMPVPDLGEGVELNLEDFKTMIQQVAFAASTDEARPVLQGVKMEIVENEITLAATDGFRISVRKESLSNPIKQDVSIIIPARALNELARIFGDSRQGGHHGHPAGTRAGHLPPERRRAGVAVDRRQLPRLPRHHAQKLQDPHHPLDPGIPQGLQAGGDHRPRGQQRHPPGHPAGGRRRGAWTSAR